MKKTDKLNIKYEDKYLLVVQKPSKLLTISTTSEKEKTLYHRVYLYLKQKNQKVFIIHRLDYETSGLIIFAKNLQIKQYFQTNWSNVTRRYMAIVSGKMTTSGTIKTYLKTTKTNLVYSTNDSKNGKLAITNYQIIKSSNKYTLLDIDIKTGRKNQIRVHLADLNHPIIGDLKYNKTKTKYPRMYLHAYYLDFLHPITKKSIKLELDIPKEFFNIINQM